jgi:hypothetical protein
MCVGTVGAFTDAAVCLGEFGATDEEDEEDEEDKEDI